MVWVELIEILRKQVLDKVESWAEEKYFEECANPIWIWGRNHHRIKTFLSTPTSHFHRGIYNKSFLSVREQISDGNIHSFTV